ncbi:MAG TPA: hypothetical protein ENK18_28245 [Deltaproteobacteria bacterium]|nr:hypothetical protein [Deltaproteobacteria bacterium]
MMLLLGMLACIPSSIAHAQSDLDVTEEIVVWGDLFARWDDTRWMIATEVAMPFRLTLSKDENLEFQTQQFQIRAIFACSKDWRLNKRKYEVGCEIQDFGIKAAIAEDRIVAADIERAQAVLDEIDAKLHGALVQLHVADDGRVLDLDLEGLANSNRRQSRGNETLRQLMSRLVVGFNLKLQRYNQLHQGKWVEYNSTLMTMPLPPGVAGNLGSNMLVHYLNRFQGQVIVQSIGKGMTTVGLDRAYGPTNYETDLIGVSLFDQADGFMTERVWALEGKSTASAQFDNAGTYFHAGKIYLIGDQDRPTCGHTEVVNGRKQHLPNLPEWVPIER